MISEDVEAPGRRELHDLVDRLPAPLVPLVRGLMLTVFAWTPQSAGIGDDSPLDALLRDAPEDDEPITEEDIAAIDESRAEFERGEFVRLEDIGARS